MRRTAIFCFLIAILSKGSGHFDWRPHTHHGNDIIWSKSRTQNELIQPEDFPTDIKCEHNVRPEILNQVNKTYIINLNLPPEHRYTEVARDKGGDIKIILKAIKDISKKAFGSLVFDFLEATLPVVQVYMPEPFRGEMFGIAEEAGVAVSDVVFLNIFYELFTFCTSIVVEKPDGHVMHGRNLDFGFLMLGDDEKYHQDIQLIAEALKDVTVQFDYRRDGKTVFRSTGFAGIIGVLTGYKPGKFSLTINERFSVWEPGVWGMMKWFMGSGAQWNMVLTRQVVENATDYDHAVRMLSETPLIANAYFTVGGSEKHTGSVITRSDKKSYVWNLGQRSRQQKSTWYLLETNYDNWNIPPAKDTRRAAGIKCMDEMKRTHVTKEGLFDVLYTIPIRNHVTVYTTLMDVNENFIKTWLSHCNQPNCKPL